MDYPPHILAPYFSTRTFLATIGTTPAIFAPASRDRVLLAIGFTFLPVTGSVSISPDRITALLPGWTLPATGILTFAYHEWGATVGLDWWGVNDLGSAVVSVHEMLYRPERK